MKHRNSLLAIPGIAALMLVVAGSGCSLLKSKDDSEATKAAQALQSANAVDPGAAPSAPSFDIVVPGASNNPARESPRAVVATTHVAANGGSGGRGATSALLASSSTASGGQARTTRTTATTNARSTVATVATAPPAATSPSTAGLLAVGQRTAANSVSTSTVAATPPATAAPPATSTPPAATSATTGRRRASVFSGSGLFAAGGATANTRGNRTVDAPTRQGVQ